MDHVGASKSYGTRPISAKATDDKKTGDNTIAITVRRFSCGIEEKLPAVCAVCCATVLSCAIAGAGAIIPTAKAPNSAIAKSSYAYVLLMLGFEVGGNSS